MESATLEVIGNRTDFFAAYRVIIFAVAARRAVAR